MINIHVEGKDYCVPEETKLGDHLYHRSGNYFIDTEEKFSMVKNLMDQGLTPKEAFPDCKESKVSGFIV